MRRSLIKNFTFYGYEYEGDAQIKQKELEKRYTKVKLVREKTDIKGLKLYSLWIR